MTVRITGEAARFVAAEVAAGRYPDADAVVAEALALLQDDPDAAYWRRIYFKELIQHGVDQADRGEVIEVTDVGAWLGGLGRNRNGA